MTQTVDTWTRLQSLFKQAIEQPASLRDAFIAHTCANHDSMARQLRDLIQAHEGAGAFLDEPAWSASAVDFSPESFDVSLVGRQIGQYQVTRGIASGGMGSVYEAQQENPRRTVALKVIRAGFGSRSAQRRFEFEVEVLGRLQHPAIAQIFEAGAFDLNGVVQPFFAMELVNGVPLTHYARSRSLSLAQRLQLLVKVCMGVDHAHQRGVIHRDLKPGNILVADGDSDPQPKILDFGVARAVGTQVQPETLTAQGSQLIGTLAYMCPEQIFGDPSQIDTRADVYALGVLMYELLADRLPLHDLTSKTFGEALRAIREDEPPKLSEIARACRGDLEWIAMKAIAKEPARRYGSAAELAADIQRHLNHEPVLAGPPSAAYRTSKWVRRHRAASIAVSSIALMLVIGIAGLTAMYLEVRQQRDIATSAQAASEESERQAKSLFQQSVRLSGSMSEFAEQELANLAGNSRARVELARRALEEFDALRDKAGEAGESILYSHSYVVQRVGEAQSVIGQSALALETFQKALLMRQRWVELSPDDPMAHRALGVGHWRVSDALILLGRLDEAQQQNQIAKDIFKQVHDRFGFTALEAGVYLGIADRRIADLDLLQNRPESAFTNYVESLQLYETGLKDNGDNLELLRGKGLVLRGIGESRTALNQIDLATAALEHSMQMFTTIGERTGPTNVWERSNLTKSKLALASALRKSDPSAAELSARQALHLSAALAGADPWHFPSSLLEAQSHIALANLAQAAGQTEPISEQARLAIGILEGLTTRDPDHAQAKQELQAAQGLLQSSDH
jgi:serine/threonine protein kinase